ncbi:hypothetical protein [Halovivax gelatinilyticus]|uniref:hypothetical protein n=1 Tax=Halovivax gelatinilyticus TaxID=2961597 RepID=UPI0020CA74C4|nr:hypothetical protein [Halovivax gelatinilyticus]
MGRASDGGRGVNEEDAVLTDDSSNSTAGERGRDAVDVAGPGSDDRSKLDRRSALTYAGAVGLSGLGALVLAPSPPNRPATADAATDVDVSFDDPITTEDESPVARYQYRPTGDGFASTAPINVVFPLADSAAGLSAVMAVLKEAGWTGDIEEYGRYAWDRTRARFIYQEATAAETAAGLHGRLHVRCWEFEGVVSMQAHEDSAARPRHRIASYVDAREAISGLFQAAGWRLAPEMIDLTNGGGADHDGLAAVIVPGPDRWGRNRTDGGESR